MTLDPEGFLCPYDLLFLTGARDVTIPTPIIADTSLLSFLTPARDVTAEVERTTMQRNLFISHASAR